MTAASDHYLRALASPFAPHGDIEVVVTGEGDLASSFAVTDFAAASIAVAGVAVRRLQAILGRSDTSPLMVDRRLASWWFLRTFEPIGWTPGPVWDAIAGVYPTADEGFVRLHTNAPHHREAALAVLECAPDREAVAAAVATWPAESLEQAVVDAGGVAAACRTREQWRAHPQGMALASEPHVRQRSEPASPARRANSKAASVARPLAGVRVLDLTRVLAGPVSTRFLAGLGADVVRIDPPWWNEPTLGPEVNLGKRCARLDLREDDDRARFEALLADADMVVHGYRRDALAGLGYGPEVRRRMNPGLVDVSLNAYGHAGPWADRRGFDSIVQIASGVAAAEADASGSDAPVPLPAQALDHATGYTMAAAAVTGWAERLVSGHGSTWLTSLAAHAEILCGRPQGPYGGEVRDPADEDRLGGDEHTPWGPLRRLRFPIQPPSMHLRWDRPATDHGTTVDPRWSV
ncbi:MAG: CoA transferase [Actinomycetota bacterium]